MLVCHYGLEKISDYIEQQEIKESMPTVVSVAVIADKLNNLGQLFRRTSYIRDVKKAVSYIVKTIWLAS